MRRRSAWLALAAALVAAGSAWAPPIAEAAEATDSGWWWRAQSGQAVALPAPPGVPDGALAVQGAPDGAVAVAAVRFELGEDETAPVLQLRFAEGGGGEAAAAAVVLACPATTPWRSGSAQPWGEKPVPDCSRQAIGAPTEDGAGMRFDLSSFVSGPVVDVVLLPGTVADLPEGLNGSSFNLVFERPAAADLVTIPAGAPIPAPSVTDPPAAATTPAAATGAAGAAAPAPAARPTPSFRPPAAPVAPALPAAEVAAPVGTAAPAGAAVPAFAPPEVDAGAAKALAVVLLVLAGVAALAGGRLPWLAATSGAQPAVAGIGRFARQRDGAPPTLR